MPSSGSIQYGDIVSSTELRAEALDRLYQLITPMKPHDDPSLCRDEFLRRYFANLDLPEIQEDTNCYGDGDYFFDDDDDDADFEELIEEEDKLGLEPLLCRIGSGTSIFSLAPNYNVKKEVSFSSFLRKRKRKAILSALIKRCSYYDVDSYQMTKLHLSYGAVNKYEKFLEAMQQCSFFFLISRAIYHLNILQRSSLTENFVEIRNIPNNLFGWSLEDFFKRRELKDFVYLDVLVLDNTFKSLDVAKYRCDLGETLRIIKILHKDMVKGEGYRKILSILWEQKLMLTIEKSLERSITEGLEKLAKANLKSQHFSEFWWDQYKTRVSSDVHNSLIETSILRPIEMRYLKSYYESVVETNAMKCNLKTDKQEKKLNHLRETMSSKSIASATALELYSYMSQNYKARIDHFTKRLNDDSEYWENQILMTSFRYSKAKDDLKEAIEKMDFMHRRIAEVEDQIVADREEEIYRLAHEQEVLKQKIAEEKQLQRQKKLSKLKKSRAKKVASVAARQKHVKTKKTIEETN